MEKALCVSLALAADKTTVCVLTAIVYIHHFIKTTITPKKKKGALQVKKKVQVVIQLGLQKTAGDGNDISLYLIVYEA